MKLHPKLSAFLKLSLYFARREIKNRIAGTILGPITALIQPLLMVLIFIFLFSIVFKVKLGKGESSYTLFMISGFIPWAQFQESLIKAAVSVVENRDAIKKISFPIFSVVVGNVLAIYLIYLVPFAMLVGYCLLKALITAHIPFWKAFFLSFFVLLCYVCQFAVSIGMGAVLSALTVYLRDLVQFLSVALQVWFYATPVIYTLDMVPDKYRLVMKLNLWTWLLEAYRETLLAYSYPDTVLLITILATSFATMICGYMIFKYLKRGFADVL